MKLAHAVGITKDRKVPATKRAVVKPTSDEAAELSARAEANQNGLTLNNSSFRLNACSGLVTTFEKSEMEEMARIKPGTWKRTSPNVRASRSRSSILRAVFCSMFSTTPISSTPPRGCSCSPHGVLPRKHDRYLLAPKSGASGVVFFHWENMKYVRPGDVIFSYANQSIGAIGIASSAAYDALQPAEFEGGWENEGRRIDVTYVPVEPAVKLESFVEELVEVLPSKNSPITKLRKGVQGYLFSIPPDALELICKRLDKVVSDR